MFVNRYQLNVNNVSSGETGNYFNIPFNIDFQIVDQTEIVDRVFVDVETEKAINPIIDYEKVRFQPVDADFNKINKIRYNVILSNGSTFDAASFSYDDIRFQRETFKQTFLNLNFYDSDNPLSQNLVTNITLYPQLNSSNLVGPSSPLLSYSSIGQVLQPNEIPLSFIIDTKDRDRIDLMKHLRNNTMLAVKLQLLDKPMFNNVIFTAQKMSLLDVSKEENKKEAIN
jgi:hypothetical protein